MIVHLDGTNRFWSMSSAAAGAGELGRVLDGFDPIVTPVAMVDAGRGRSPSEVVDAFAESTARLIADLAAFRSDASEMLGEAPRAT